MAGRSASRRKSPEPRWLMPLIDLALAFLAYALAYFVRYEVQLLRPVNEFSRAPFEPYIPYAIVYIVWLFVNFRGSGLYRVIRGRSWIEEVGIILNAVTNATVLVMAISFIFQPLVFSRLLVIYVAVITIFLLSGARIIRRIVLSRMRERGIGVERVLVVGSGEVGQAILRTMLARAELGYRPVAYLDDSDEGHASMDLGRVKGLKDVDALAMHLREHKVDMVVITLPWSDHDRIIHLIRTCQRARVQVSVVPDVFQLNLRQVLVENLDGIPLLLVNGQVPLRGGSRLFKRVVDLGLVALASPLLLLVFGAVALAIKLEGPGPVFYTARRVGENGHEFNMVKFRSMILDAEKLREELIRAHDLDPRHPKIKDDPRITRVGRFIRRTSIDELPNLINVLRGEMSLVGPRPPTPEEVSLYDSWHLQRLQVKPGMTGLWQVSGRSEVPFDEMCLLDIYYIENWTMTLDAQILMMTIPRVLLRHGAY